MGLSINRTIALHGRFQSRIKGRLNEMIREHQSQQWLLASLSVMYEDPAFKQLPQWARASLESYKHGVLEVVSNFMTVSAYRLNKHFKGSLMLHTWEPGHRNGKLRFDDKKSSSWSVLYDEVIKEGKTSFGVWEKKNVAAAGFYWPSGRVFFETPMPGGNHAENK